MSFLIPDVVVDVITLPTETSFCFKNSLMIDLSASTNTFRFTLWRKLFTRFGVELFRQFRSLSPSDQVDALFSGFYGQEVDENVRLESLKILLQSLKLLSWHLPLDKLMLS